MLSTSNVVNQILRYVAGMKDISLKYSKFPSFILSRFSHSDYEGYRYDRKLTYDYVFSISSGVIS